MLSLLQFTAGLLLAFLKPDITLLENKQVTFKGNLEASERYWDLGALGASIPSDWSSYRFLILEVKASTPQRFQLKIYTSEGVSPLYVHAFQNAWVRAVVPLQMFTTPPGHGSTLSDVFNKQRAGYFMFHWGPYMPVNQVKAVGVAMPEPIGDPTVEIRALRLAARSPGDAVLENDPLVDLLGQWIRDQWPDKVDHLEELQNAWKQEETQLKPGDFGYCKFGGYRSTQAKATGFFRVEQVNGIWWIVDPDGHLFFSAGADVMTPRMETPIRDRQAVFSQLPPPDQVPTESERMRPEVSFFHWNIIRRFGTSWENPWVDLTARRMAAWGLNTAGNWSSSVLFDSQRVPYTVPLDGWNTQQTYFGLPDVYSDEFVKNCEGAAQLQCAKRKKDPYLLGYFIGNEPPWPGREEALAEMILSGPDTATRREFQKQLTAGDSSDKRKALALLFRLTSFLSTWE